MGKGHPFRFAVSGSNAASAKEWVDTAQRAEALGYSAFHVSDHYVGPGGPVTGIQGLAAVPAMAVAAAVTKDLRIGARVFCIDFHVPAVLAKEAATIDFLSDGRLELGLGAGWVTEEYEVLGIPMDPVGKRIERLIEMIALVKAWFSGEPIEIDGQYIHVRGFTGSPESPQRPHPPIIIGGGAKRVLTLAGREADIVSFNFNNRGGVVGPDSVQSSTAEVTDQRVEWVREGAGDRFDQLEFEVGAYFTVVTDDPQGAAGELGGRFGVDADTMRHHPNALFGSISEMCDELEARRQRFGFNYITVATRNMEAFAPVVERLAGK